MGQGKCYGGTRSTWVACLCLCWLVECARAYGGVIIAFFEQITLAKKTVTVCRFKVPFQLTAHSSVHLALFGDACRGAFRHRLAMLALLFGLGLGLAAGAVTQCEL